MTRFLSVLLGFLLLVGCASREPAVLRYGVQDAPEVEVQDPERLQQITPFAFQAHQERRRNQQTTMSCGLRRCLVRINRVRFANGLGEETQAALLDFRRRGSQRLSDQALVSHYVCSRVCE